jgi:hypothetical protein
LDFPIENHPAIHQPRCEAKDRISASIGETMILVDALELLDYFSIKSWDNDG